MLCTVLVLQWLSVWYPNILIFYVVHHSCFAVAQCMVPKHFDVLCCAPFLFCSGSVYGTQTFWYFMLCTILVLQWFSVWYPTILIFCFVLHSLLYVAMIVCIVLILWWLSVWQTNSLMFYVVLYSCSAVAHCMVPKRDVLCCAPFLFSGGSVCVTQTFWYFMLCTILVLQWLSVWYPNILIFCFMLHSLLHCRGSVYGTQTFWYSVLCSVLYCTAVAHCVVPKLFSSVCCASFFIALQWLIVWYPNILKIFVLHSLFTAAVHCMVSKHISILCCAPFFVALQ